MNYPVAKGSKGPTKGRVTQANSCLWVVEERGSKVKGSGFRVSGLGFRV